MKKFVLLECCNSHTIVAIKAIKTITQTRGPSAPFVNQSFPICYRVISYGLLCIFFKKTVVCH